MEGVHGRGDARKPLFFVLSFEPCASSAERISLTGLQILDLSLLTGARRSQIFPQKSKRAQVPDQSVGNIGDDRSSFASTAESEHRMDWK